MISSLALARTGCYVVVIFLLRDLTYLIFFFVFFFFDCVISVSLYRLYVLILHVRLRWLVRSKLISWNHLQKMSQSDEEAHWTVPKPCSQTCVPHDMDMHSWKLGCLSNYVAQKYGNTDRRHPPILTSMYKNALPFDSF